MIAMMKLSMIMVIIVMVAMTENEALLALYNTLKKYHFEAFLFILGFSRYLMDKDCDVISSEETREITQDMTRPLSHYYIASSHNT